MKTNLKLFAIIYALCAPSAYAGMAEIKNETDSPIIVFLRLNGQPYSENNYYQTSAIPKHDKMTFMVDKSLFGLESDQFFYDIIASSSLESSIKPDWRLLAAECDNLFSGNNTVMVIQTAAGGLKTTCTVLKN
jgi:hypothetical protein